MKRKRKPAAKREAQRVDPRFPQFYGLTVTRQETLDDVVAWAGGIRCEPSPPFGEGRLEVAAARLLGALSRIGLTLEQVEILSREAAAVDAAIVESRSRPPYDEEAVRAEERAKCLAIVKTNSPAVGDAVYCVNALEEYLKTCGRAPSPALDAARERARLRLPASTPAEFRARLFAYFHASADVERALASIAFLLSRRIWPSDREIEETQQALAARKAIRRLLPSVTDLATLADAVVAFLNSPCGVCARPERVPPTRETPETTQPCREHRNLEALVRLLRRDPLERPRGEARP